MKLSTAQRNALRSIIGRLGVKLDIDPALLRRVTMIRIGVKP